MDDQTKNTESNTTPAPINETPVVSEPVAQPPVAAEPPQSPPSLAEEPAAPTPPASSETPSVPAASMPVTPAAESAPVAPVDAKPAETAPTSGASSSKKKIAFALIIAVILIGAAVSAYFVMNADSEKTGHKSAAEQAVAEMAEQSQAAGPLTMAEVDVTTNELDAAIAEADAVQDTATGDLDDSALGL